MIEQLLASNEKLVHRLHQQIGAEQLVLDTDPNRTAEWSGGTVSRSIPNVFALFDEVGAGKTKQVVDAAQILYLWGRIDTMLIIAPGYARSTWADDDPTLGEVAKHAWDIVPNIVHEFHRGYTDLDMTDKGLHWVVSNFEFIRQEHRMDEMIKVLKGRRVWMVVDESWNIKNRSLQTRACIKIRRKRADRATILNGTPLSDGKPKDLFYQMMFLDPGILGVDSQSKFKAHYCITKELPKVEGEKYTREKVVDYQNMDEFNARVAPYTLSRRTRDCFDLPPMLDPVTIEATLTKETWKIYQQMRDDMVAWLGTQATVSKAAITKVLRLAQITSGFLGGLETIEEDFDLTAPSSEPTNQPIPDWLKPHAAGPFGPAAPPVISPHGVGKLTKPIGREKLDAFLKWFDELNRPHKMLAWCRFKPELERLRQELFRYYPEVLELRGGQAPEVRRAVKEFLAPDGNPAPGAVVGISGTGAASLNFSGAWLMVFMSHDPALIKRTQSIGRVERPGQKSPMLIVDVVAHGPKGQKTVDHHILKALREKQDMATWTVNRWRKMLEDE